MLNVVKPLNNSFKCEGVCPKQPQNNNFALLNIAFVFFTYVCTCVFVYVCIYPCGQYICMSIYVCVYICMCICVQWQEKVCEPFVIS